MKFTKFGKALLMGAISIALLFCVTSCVESYSVGYLYVTGTDTAQSSGNGIISGYSIDHNTGKLTLVRTLPVSSGGANPVRAILTGNSRFLYVLNRGTNATGGDCTTADWCTGSNITLFAVGGNGVLTQQEQFPTLGINPFRMIADPSQSYIYVLDHDSPVPTDPSNPNSPVVPSSLPNYPNQYCAAALTGARVCAAVEAYSINQSTGRLSLIEDNAVTAAGGSPLTYFPVPSNPVDFILNSQYLLTLSSTTPQTSYPYTGGSTVFPYLFPGTGQLTITSNSAQTITDSSQSGVINEHGVPNGTALSAGGAFLYVLDDNPIYLNGSSTYTSQSQILQYKIGTNGTLDAQNGGSVPDDPAQSNPSFAVQESKGKWVYVANQGIDINSGASQNGITGYIIDPTTSQLTELSGLPFTTGAGPQCLVEDPSDQFFYTANYYDSTVTGNSLDVNSGYLVPLSQNHNNVPSSYTLPGPATWCLIDGRTN